MQETPRKLRILVAPLDWGLGHATRCIPVIRELLRQDCEVIIAGEGAQQALLGQEFPQLQFLELEGYRVKYTRNGKGLSLKMIRQWPRLQRTIRKENEWLKKVVAAYKPDAIISDNRYGLYHSSVRSVLIIHQLCIKSPFGKWTERLLQRINYKYINRFNQCWVPDMSKGNNLSGELGHPEKMPAIPVKYIGALSRFKNAGLEEKKNHLLVILSGPEPQRTLLEDKIITEISHYNGTADVVRGMPGYPNQIPSTGMIHFYNHLPAAALNEKMQEAEYIISRSGYSTVMDIVALGKKSILIPTPGQTEQEYLAAFLAEKQMALTVTQDAFSLEEVLQKASAFNFNPLPAGDNQLLVDCIANLIKDIEKKL